MVSYTHIHTFILLEDGPYCYYTWSKVSQNVVQNVCGLSYFFSNNDKHKESYYWHFVIAKRLSKADWGINQLDNILWRMFFALFNKRLVVTSLLSEVILIRNYSRLSWSFDSNLEHSTSLIFLQSKCRDNLKTNLP